MSFESKVLLIEDDPQVVSTLEMSLAPFPVDITKVDNAERAAELIRRDEFDAIFIDLSLRGMERIDLASHVRTTDHNRRKPVVVITDKTDMTAMKRAYLAGATFLLHKPLTVAKLNSVVRTVCAPVSSPEPLVN